MNLTPPPLQKGDLIEIVAPAKAIDAEHVYFTQKYLENCGFRVKISPNCLGQHHYFSGDVPQRLSDIQNAIDDPEVKAILCARGGYGCLQIVDKIQWANFVRFPKWLIGFSDVTVFHQQLAKMGIPSIHGTMPLNFSSNSKEALDTLIRALTTQEYSISCQPHGMNRTGKANGKLVGGNLSILFSLLGTNGQAPYDNTILFIEDLAEPIYHIDRMFYAFEKAGILDRIKGLIVGGMTDLTDTATPFGKNCEEVILSHFEYNRIPICFGFPAGHIDDNRALILGRDVQLEINDNETLLTFTK